LPVPGPAGQDRDRGDERHPHTGLLLRRQPHAVLAGQPAEGHGPIDLPEDPPGRGPDRRLRQTAQPAGQPRLRPRERRQRQQAPVLTRPRARDHVAGSQEGFHRRTDPGHLDAQQLGRLPRQVRLGQQGVALVGRGAERVQGACLQAFGRIDGNADRASDLIGRLEADAPHLARQPVRLLADDPPTVVAELLVDAHRQRGRHAKALERRHDFTDVALLRPGGGNARRPDRADPGHRRQALHIRVDHLERRLAKGVHDPPRHHRPDTLHQPAAQVLLHPLQRGRQGSPIVLGLELPAVLGVIAPPAVSDDGLAGCEVGQAANQGHQPIVVADCLDLGAGPLGSQAGDGVPVLGVLVGDPLDDPP